MSNLLVEIGTEELPLAALDAVYFNLKTATHRMLEDHRIGFKSIFVEATPRRIALFVEGLADRQEDRELELSGPSFEKSYDAQGNPTPALQGFLKSKGAGLKEIEIKETPKGRFIVVRKKEKGKSAAAVLPLLLRNLVSSLNFSKSMRWEKTGFRFPRPIRWIVALLDRKLIPVQLADVKTSRQSFGHRFLSPKSFTILKADWSQYQALLKKGRVTLSLVERESVIRKGLQRFNQKTFDEDLVHTTAQLAEDPFLIQASFSSAYLDLPAEVLASCMKKNQKIFACYDTKGRLINRFVAVLNGKRRGLAKIRADYENVLESRLRDARYFYDLDTKTSLEDKLPLLDQIVYLGKLGTLRKKTERLEHLAGIFAGFIGREDIKEDLKRAARLSKIDLMTQMVFEFPDLQGIMGREYAFESKEKEAVALAIGTQYLPKNLMEDQKDLKKQMTSLGAMLGLTDRLDLLVGAFGTGVEPTGSQDPFALRRAGGIFIKIVRAFGFHFSLNEMIEAAAALYGKILDRPLEELKKRLGRFFQERMAYELQAEFGSRSYEILQAVWRSHFDDLADTFKRYDILRKMYEEDPKAFLKAAKVVERTANILKGAGSEVPSVKREFFQEPLEEELYRLIEEKSAEIAQALERRDYEKATLRFGQIFYEPLHRFFDKVLVNVEDKQIRSNRQALMKQIYSLYAERLADLSVLSRIDEG